MITFDPRELWGRPLWWDSEIHGGRKVLNVDACVVPMFPIHLTEALMETCLQP